MKKLDPFIDKQEQAESDVQPSVIAVLLWTVKRRLQERNLTPKNLQWGLLCYPMRPGNVSMAAIEESLSETRRDVCRMLH